MTRKKLILALAIAGGSDGISFLLGLTGPLFLPVVMPIQWVLDIATALVLFAVLGWHWVLLPGLITEAIPGLEMLPLWLMVVAIIGAQHEVTQHKGGGPVDAMVVHPGSAGPPGHPGAGDAARRLTATLNQPQPPRAS